MRAIPIGAVLAILWATSSAGKLDAERSALGESEFINSCASCHGSTGKGDGPAIKSLIKPPPDLTKLSENNNGEFPFIRVYEVIDGRTQLLTHGARDMPVWGQIYRRSMSPTSDNMAKEVAESLVRIRILALIDYIATLQEK
jgi:mono/diheme cytochrome c family protein